MKLEFHGHDERYVVEQSLMNLFPGELPVYEPIAPGDGAWAKITCDEAGDYLVVTTDLFFHGQSGVYTYGAPLSGTDFDREGQRRHAVGACFYLARREMGLPDLPWGMLTGVRPDKPVTWALEQGKTPGEAQAFLENEYFVTPERAALAVETGSVAAQAAAGLGERDIAVYVGIPFCPTRCAYCSFVSADVGRALKLLPPFLEVLLQEVDAAAAELKRAGYVVRSLYVGGGTPTTLSAEQLNVLLGRVGEKFDLSRCTEYTVEAGRPDTITAEKLAAIRNNGVQRVSVNPQTMQDHVLAAMGRAHTAADILKAFELVRASGIPCVNMDLIAGLPQDTPAGFRASLDQVLALEPENVTVHTLALKKGSRLMGDGSGEGPVLPTAEEVAEMLSYAWSALRAHGQVPYYLYRQKYMSGSFENVGWTKPGWESLYNICMMEELHTILSLGGGGVTKLVNPYTGRIERIANPKYPHEYVESLEKLRTGKRQAADFLAALREERH